MNSQPQVPTQALVPPSNKKGQVNPQQVWDHLTPTQQQIVFQNLVVICQHLLQQVSQIIQPGVPNEDE